MHAAAAAMALVGVPAQATCWTPQEVTAAKIRDLDTMLMVSALRCRTGTSGMLAAYNAFVVQDRVALTRVNEELRGHFAKAVGKAGALNAYDNYVTAVANSYGAGSEGLSCDNMVSIVQAATAEGATYEALSEIADRAGVQPRIDGGACPTVIASAQ
jgi:hypothetical protein